MLFYHLQSDQFKLYIQALLNYELYIFTFNLIMYHLVQIHVEV